MKAEEKDGGTDFKTLLLPYDAVIRKTEQIYSVNLKIKQGDGLKWRNTEVKKSF